MHREPVLCIWISLDHRLHFISFWKFIHNCYGIVVSFVHFVDSFIRPTVAGVWCVRFGLMNISMFVCLFVDFWSVWVCVCGDAHTNHPSISVPWKKPSRINCWRTIHQFESMSRKTCDLETDEQFQISTVCVNNTRTIVIENIGWFIISVFHFKLNLKPNCWFTPTTYLSHHVILAVVHKLIMSN